jgi:hypothetical protein
MAYTCVICSSLLRSFVIIGIMHEPDVLWVRKSHRFGLYALPPPPPPELSYTLRKCSLDGI